MKIHTWRGEERLREAERDFKTEGSFRSLYSVKYVCIILESARVIRMKQVGQNGPGRDA